MTPLFEQAYFEDQLTAFKQDINTMHAKERAMKKKDDERWASIGDSVILPKYRKVKLNSYTIGLLVKSLMP